LRERFFKQKTRLFWLRTRAMRLRTRSSKQKMAVAGLRTRLLKLRTVRVSSAREAVQVNESRRRNPPSKPAVEQARAACGAMQ
jgi:hypothetical protein